jgi:hypothetical protein
MPDKIIYPNASAQISAFLEAAQKQSEELQAAMRSLIRLFTDLAHDAYKAQQTFTESITEGFKSLVSALDKAEYLGGLGWTIPMQATPAEYIELMSGIGDIDSADEVFKKYYMEDNASRLQYLKKGILSSKDLLQWKSVIEEALLNYDEGRPRSCVALLLPMIEGVTATKFSCPNFHKREAREIFFGTKLNAIKNPEDNLIYFLWRSYKGFTETLFKYIDFCSKSTKPSVLNRHWLLHGRSILSSNETDCLRLFQALETIARL